MKLQLSAKKDTPILVFQELANQRMDIGSWCKFFFEDVLGWISTAEDRAVEKGVRENARFSDSILSYQLLSTAKGQTPVILAEVSSKTELDHVPTLRRLHSAAVELTHLRAGLGRNNTAFIFCNGSQLAILDPGRTRDHRFVITSERLDNLSRTRDGLEDLNANRITTKQRFGRSTPDFSRFFEEIPFDKQFLAYLDDYRRCVIEEVVKLPNVLRTVVQELLSAAENKGLPKFNKSAEWVSDVLENARAKEALLAATDTYLLRQILHQFIEAYHGVKIRPSHQELVEMYCEKKIVGANQVGHRSTYLSGGTKQTKSSRFQDPFVLHDAKKTDFKKAFLKLDKDYADRYRGDVHFSSLARVVEALEQELEPETIAEALDLLSQKRYSFRYSDIRPEIIETFYQNSLGTDLDISLRKNRTEFNVQAVDSGFTRKRGGSYFTQQELAEFTVRNSVSPLLEQRISLIRVEVERRAWLQASKAFERFFDLKFIDPTAGGGSFIKETFRKLSGCFDSIYELALEMPEMSQQALAKRFACFRKSTVDKRGEFEHYVLTHMLYGVDIDLKALCVASQTLTLESLRYLKDEEVFPNFININLKRGNIFAPVFHADDWKELAPKDVRELLKLRSEARKSKSIEELHAYFAQERKLVMAMSADAIAENTKRYGQGYKSLDGFAWQLEFPEVYFDDTGTPKENPGFDAVVGNPPWDAIEFTDDEFFRDIDPDWPEGKDVGRTAKDRRKSQLFKKIPGLEERYAITTTGYDTLNQIINANNYYKCQRPKNNTWKLATELYPELVKRDGRFGFLIPEGFAGDERAAELREHYLKAKFIETLIGFNKENDCFSATQAFVIVIGDKNGDADTLRYCRDLKSKKELLDLNVDKIHPIRYEEILKSSATGYALVAVREPIEEAILKRLNSFVTGQSKWEIDAQNELNTATHHHLETTTDTGYFIAKGKDAWRFRFTFPKRFLKFREFKTEFKERRNIDSERVAWRKIAGTNDPRRMVSTLLPPRVSAYDSFNVVKTPMSPFQRRVLVAILNSFVFEFWIRGRSKNNNISIFYIKEGPIPKVTDGDKIGTKIVDLVDKIYRGKTQRDPKTEAKIEALVASMYGLSKKEFSHILNSFTKVPDEARDALSEFERL